MKITIEPTPEVCTLDELQVDPDKCRMRVWRGLIEGKATADVYVFAVVPDTAEGAKLFRKESPDYIRPAREQQHPKDEWIK